MAKRRPCVVLSVREINDHRHTVVVLPLTTTETPDQLSGASRTFVVVDDADRVRGFYALAAGAVAHQTATNSVKRNMPDPIPVMVLGRLAVDRRAQGIQLGAALLQDAVRRAITVSQNTGVRALLVHALHEQAKQFYEHYGFQASPQHPLTLMLRLKSCKELYGA